MFQNGDQKIIKNTGDKNLDGKIVTVVGIVEFFHVGIGSIYIVEGDFKNWKCITITDACLDSIRR
jgi:hypothetical protein